MPRSGIIGRYRRHYPKADPRTFNTNLRNYHWELRFPATSHQAIENTSFSRVFCCSEFGRKFQIAVFKDAERGLARLLFPSVLPAHAAWRVAEAGAEQAVEMGDVGKARLQCDLGNPALAMIAGQQRESLLQPEFGDPRGERRSGCL